MALGGGRAWDGRGERPEFGDTFPIQNPDVEVAIYKRILARDWQA